MGVPLNPTARVIRATADHGCGLRFCAASMSRHYLCVKLREKLLQCMPQLGDRSIPIGRVFHQTALDNLVDAVSQAWRGVTDIDGTIEGGLCLGMLMAQGIIDRPLNGRAAGDHLEEDDTKGVEVSADVDGAGIAELFGGHVRPRPQPNASTGQARVGQSRREEWTRLFPSQPWSWRADHGYSVLDLLAEWAVPGEEKAGVLTVGEVVTLPVPIDCGSVERVPVRFFSMPARFGEAGAGAFPSLGSVQMID